MSNKIRGEKMCGNCTHSFIEGASMYCTLNPPTTSPIIIVAQLPDGGVVPNVLGWASNYPSVKPERKCGQHEWQLTTIEGESRRFPDRFPDRRR